MTRRTPDSDRSSNSDHKISKKVHAPVKLRNRRSSKTPKPRRKSKVVCLSDKERCGLLGRWPTVAEVLQLVQRDNAPPKGPKADRGRRRSLAVEDIVKKSSIDDYVQTPTVTESVELSSTVDALVSKSDDLKSDISLIIPHDGIDRSADVPENEDNDNIPKSKNMDDFESDSPTRSGIASKTNIQQTRGSNESNLREGRIPSITIEHSSDIDDASDNTDSGDTRKSGKSKKRSVDSDRQSQDEELQVSVQEALCLERWEDWRPEQVAQWVEEMGFPQYKACFVSNVISGKRLHNMRLCVMPRIGIGDFTDAKFICRAIYNLLEVEPESWELVIWPNERTVPYPYNVQPAHRGRPWNAPPEGTSEESLPRSPTYTYIYP